MLVLTRKKGERVLIGDDIVVTVIDVRGDGIRIGFDAPRGVKIQRAEVLKAVSEANTGAAANAAVTADLLVGLLTARAAAPVPAAAPPQAPPPTTDATSADAGPVDAAPAVAGPDAATSSRPKPTPPRAR